MRLRRMRAKPLRKTAAALFAAVLYLTCRGTAEAGAESPTAYQPLSAMLSQPLSAASPLPLSAMLSQPLSAASPQTMYIAAFQPLYGEETDEAAFSRGEMRLQQLARAISAFRARIGEEVPLAVLSGYGQTLCNRIGDARFPDTLSAVCLEEVPECFDDAYQPDELCLSAAEDALCAPDAVGGAVRVTRNGEDISGDITAVIGDFVFSK